MWNNITLFLRSRLFVLLLLAFGLAGAFLFSSTSTASAQHCVGPDGSPCTPTPGPSPTPGIPTWEPFFQTPTPGPTIDARCPLGQIVGFGTVTPDPAWSQTCSVCVSTQIPTAVWPTQPVTMTPYPTVTVSGTSIAAVTVTPTRIVTLTVAPTPTPTPTPNFTYTTITVINNWNGAWYKGFDYYAADVCPGSSPEIDAYMVTGAVTGGANRWFYEDIPISALNNQVLVSGQSYTFYNHVYSQWLAAGSPVEFNTGTRFTALWQGGLSRVKVHFTFDDTQAGSVTWTTAKLLCRSTSYATPVPTVIPYCSIVKPKPVDREDYFPMPRVGVNNCDIWIPGFTLDLSFLTSLGVTWLPASVTFANISICYREISFGFARLFGVDINLDFMAGISVSITLLRMMLRT